MHIIEELSLYQKARKFRMEISDLTKSFPEEEKYLLRSQIIRSSRSVTAQIAEGHGRYHYQENIQYCRIARGSLSETHDHINVALDEGYITEARAADLKQKKAELMKMINGYIRYMRQKKAE